MQDNCITKIWWQLLCRWFVKSCRLTSYLCYFSPVFVKGSWSKCWHGKYCSRQGCFSLDQQLRHMYVGGAKNDPHVTTNEKWYNKLGLNHVLHVVSCLVYVEFNILSSCGEFVNVSHLLSVVYESNVRCSSHTDLDLLTSENANHAITRWVAVSACKILKRLAVKWNV